MLNLSKGKTPEMVVAVANTLRKNLNAPSLTLLTMELLKSGGVQVSLWWGHAEEVAWHTTVGCLDVLLRRHLRK